MPIAKNVTPKLASALVLGAALLATGAAHANTWNWAYTGSGVSASGTLTTAGAALVPEDILSISGQRNGMAILGLVPLGTNDNFDFDNQFTSIAPYFSAPGMLYDVGGGETGVINVYFFGGQTFDLYVVDQEAFEVPITFTISAVPEAATVAQMGLGLATLSAFLLRRRSRAANGDQARARG